jgi:hypothetical protein
MPAQYSGGSHDGRDLTQCLSAEGFALHAQPPALIIGQADPLFALSMEQRLDLLALEFNNCLLLSLGPAHQNHD